MVCCILGKTYVSLQIETHYSALSTTENAATISPYRIVFLRHIPILNNCEMIDLHTHTDKSDGSLSAGELARLAGAIGLEALAITDHDTFAGFDQAAAFAREIGIELDLVCGIELSVKYRDRSVHLLGYFLTDDPHPNFRQWIIGLQNGRQLRNQALASKLQSAGFEITLQEVQQLKQGPVGRIHFAALMVEKGYVSSAQQAFDLYLDQSAPCHVSRDEPSLDEVIARIGAAKGISSLPHPVRITRDPALLERYLGEMRDMGLDAIEVYHSEHSSAEVSSYVAMAAKFSLAVTGGSDFHGAAKPNIALGTGINGNVCVPASVLENLRLRD